MSTYDGYDTHSTDYAPTEDDIRAYNEDQARAEMEAQAELDNQQRLTDQPSAHQHTWTEDGATFTVIDNPHTPHLIGARFSGGSVTDREAVLAREVLRLRAIADAQASAARVTESIRKLTEAVSMGRIEVLENENLKLTDRVNALTARIEEALDLLIHETDGSRRVEQVYRMLEKVMMDNTTDNTAGATK